MANLILTTKFLNSCEVVKGVQYIGLVLLVDKQYAIPVISNSKMVTFSPAYISLANINAEETLNTLKYANRARNIQNKPVVSFHNSLLLKLLSCSLP